VRYGLGVALVERCGPDCGGTVGVLRRLGALGFGFDLFGLGLHAGRTVGFAFDVPRLGRVSRSPRFFCLEVGIWHGVS